MRNDRRDRATPQRSLMHRNYYTLPFRKGQGWGWGVIRSRVYYAYTLLAPVVSYADLQCSLLISRCLCWSPVVYSSSLHWSSVVSTGLPWSLLVSSCSSLYWSPVVSTGVLWSLLHGLQWFLLVSHGLYWSLYWRPVETTGDQYRDQ